MKNILNTLSTYAIALTIEVMRRELNRGWQDTQGLWDAYWDAFMARVPDVAERSDLMALAGDRVALEVAGPEWLSCESVCVMELFVELEAGMGLPFRRFQVAPEAQANFMKSLHSPLARHGYISPFVALVDGDCVSIHSDTKGPWWGIREGRFTYQRA